MKSVDMDSMLSPFFEIPPTAKQRTLSGEVQTLAKKKIMIHHLSALTLNDSRDLRTPVPNFISYLSIPSPADRFKFVSTTAGIAVDHKWF